MPRHFHSPLIVLTLLLAGLLWHGATVGQDQPADPAQPKADDTKAKPAGSESAESVLDRLLKKRPANEAIRPTRLPASPYEGPGTLAATAPNLNPLLKREGSFVLAKPGRVIAITDGVLSTKYTFDDDALPDMYLLPCRFLEDMETAVAKHGTDVRFLVSGQIYTYRGDNYIMPTMVKLAPHRPNLQK